MRNTTMFPESSFAASKNAPVGSITKFRGVFPLLATSPANFSVPLAASMVKIVMLLAVPRLEAYKNFPEGCTVISAASFTPVYSLGTVAIVWNADKDPFCA